MYNHAPYGRRPLGLAALVSMLTVSTAEAAVIAHFDFEDAAGNFSNVAEQVAPQLSVSAWSDADGTLKSVSGNPSSGFALTAKSFDDGNAYLLTLTPAAGFALDFTGIAFDHRISSTGPTAWQLQLNGVPFANGLTSTSFKTETINLSSAPGVNPLVVAIRGTGAGSSVGTLRLDNVTLNGNLSAVPLPASIWLLGPALVGLVNRRRNLQLGAP